MIAARLAGGNLFFGFFWLFLAFFGGGIFWWGILRALGAARSTRSTRSTRIFLRGFWVGDFGSTRIFFGGILFFGGWWGVFWIVSVGKN